MANPYAGIEYFPQTLPVNTVVGRLGNVPGPAEAIPFATLASALAIRNTALHVFHADSPYVWSGSPTVLFADATSGDIQIRLPNANSVYVVYVARTDMVYANSVVIVGTAGQLINGSSSFTMQFENQGITLASDGFGHWSVFSQTKPLTNPLTPGYKSFTNIFDLINDPNIVTQIQAGTWPNGLDVYFNAAIALGGTVFIPAGTYKFSNTLTMLPGVIFQGEGIGNTIIYTGGSGGQWGIEMLNANGTEQVEAFKLYDITFQVPSAGIRWNSITGGFTDDNTSQAYMFRPRIERCVVNQDTGGTRYIGVQMNKCFDFVVKGNAFASFLNSVNVEGSDIGVVTENRFEHETGYSVTAHNHYPFGSSLAITNNDFNDPILGYVESTYVDILIGFNHMELDQALARTDTILISGDNAFHTKIHNNRIQNGGQATNWLNISDSTNRFLVSVFNNTTSAPGEMGNVHYPSQAYFANGGFQSIVRHGGNSMGDITFPMNSQAVGEFIIPPGYAAFVSAHTPGISASGSTITPSCQNGLITIAADANAGHFVEISDWNNYGLLANQLIGTLTIELISAAAVAGQVGSWQVLDNGSSVATGTITHTVANQYYKTTLVTSHAFSTKPQVRLWNADTVRNRNFFMVSTGFKIG